MSWNIIILIIGIVIAAAVFLFGQGILRKTGRKEISEEKKVFEEKKRIFCGIEQIQVRIPSSLKDYMESIAEGLNKLWIYNVFVKNDSRSICMNPVITIKIGKTILGCVVNDTNEDKVEVEESVSIADEGLVILKPTRLGTNSFVDLTIWADWPAILMEDTVSFSSDGDFELKTKFISLRSGEKKFM